MKWDEFEEGDIIKFEDVSKYIAFFWVREKFKNDNAKIVELKNWSSKNWHISSIESFLDKSWFDNLKKNYLAKYLEANYGL